MALKPRVPRLQSGHPLNRGLVAAWLLTEGSGAAIYDASGRRTDSSSWGGTVSWTSGRNGPALKTATGSNAGYINLGTPGNLANLGPLTMAAWVWMTPGGGNNGVIFSKTDNNTVNTGIIFGVNALDTGGTAGALSFLSIYSSADKRNKSTATVATGKWSHIAMTWTGVQADLANFYIDGIDAGTNIAAGTNGTGTRGDDSSRIAYLCGTAQSFVPTSLDGVLNELRIWNRALSPSEIGQLYRSDYSEFRSPPDNWLTRAALAPATPLTFWRFRPTVDDEFPDWTPPRRPVIGTAPTPATPLTFWRFRPTVDEEQEIWFPPRRTIALFPTTNFVLNAVIPPITLLANALNMGVPAAPPPPGNIAILQPIDPIFVAVEVDLHDDLNVLFTLRLCNRGTVTRTVSGAFHVYDPRLTGLPIQLGMSVNVTQYGQPVRGQPNGGTIQFALDQTIWNWFQGSGGTGFRAPLHWIGRTFRVYEGELAKTTVDVDADMTLVYAGRVAGLQHDTLTATIQTTDASIDLDNPLVTDFYDATFPVGLQGRPKPYLWGGPAFEMAPQIENETTQTYRVSARISATSAVPYDDTAIINGWLALTFNTTADQTLAANFAATIVNPGTLPSLIAAGINRLTFNTYDDQALAQRFAATLPPDPDSAPAFTVTDVRVGGVSWNKNPLGPPGQGEWTPHTPPDGTFQLGSPPLGMEVRCNAQQGTFTVGELFRKIVTDAGGLASPDLDRLNIALPDLVSFVTTTEPINRLAALDDIANSAGCLWWVDHLGQFTAAPTDIPSNVADVVLDKTSVASLALNTIAPAAWRIRDGYARNWSPGTSFADAALQTTQQALAEPGIVLEPHFENGNALLLEPRAVDVPLFTGTGSTVASAVNTQTRLIRAWGENRTIYDATAWLKPKDVVLYNTAGVDYMMVQGNFRIISAIRAIGGGGPATLQLWGVLGPVASLPPPPTPGTGILTYSPLLSPVPFQSDYGTKAGIIAFTVNGQPAALDSIVIPNSNFPFKLYPLTPLGFGYSSWALIVYWNIPTYNGTDPGIHGVYSSGSITGNVSQSGVSSALTPTTISITVT